MENQIARPFLKWAGGKTQLLKREDPNNDFLGIPFGRALSSNLFTRISQKGFPLQLLTQLAV